MKKQWKSRKHPTIKRKTQYLKPCANCGEEKWVSHDQKYCSVNCKVDAAKGMPPDSPMAWGVPSSVAHVFNQFWQHDLREVPGPVVLTCDWHIPYHSEAWVEKMIAGAEMFGARRLYIVGDYTDQHGLSKFLDATSEDLHATIATVRAMFNKLLHHFDAIYWLQGNHDVRIAKALANRLQLDSLYELFVPKDNPKHRCIHFSTYPYAYLKYGDSEYDKWLIIHPKEYRKVALSAANDLATVHLASVYNTHGHTVGNGRHRSGRFAIVDGGGMFDATKVEYKMTQLTTHPAWANAFTIAWDDGKFITVDDRFPIDRIGAV